MMAGRTKLELNPYHRFSKAEWAQYRDGEPMTLSVGGPMREVRADRARLAAVLHAAVEPIRRATGR